MPTSAPSLSELARAAKDHFDRLERELAEIDLLIQQARIEAGRHEQKRAISADKLEAAAAGGRDADGRPAIDQLMTLTKRASLMQAQVDILEGKQKILTRFRDAMRELCDGFSVLPLVSLEASENGASPLPPELNRAVLAAQENLRREIARQMHDGPAQSLTNIVLRAQIVERLMARDPGMAQAEVHELIDMVQQTLDSTKTFIFDVRPMVLDDLGLVPTLRRSSRDRGLRSQLPVSFESVGADRRLDVEIESTIFRVLDDATAGFIATSPARVVVRLDWTDDALLARVTAEREESIEAEASEELDRTLQGPAAPGSDVPPALADMITQRRASAEAATVARATARARATALPAQTWTEIQQRASTVGLQVRLSPDGRTLEAELPLGR
jgi:two-component system sensor histidine kinase DegS